MTAAPLSWPSSRVLAGWWAHLVPGTEYPPAGAPVPGGERFGPLALWVHHLLLHRIEAQVRVSRSSPLEQLDRLVLEALAPRPTLLPELVRRLGLDAPLLRRHLAVLQREGRAHVGPGGAWALTPAGAEARASEEAIGSPERRDFYFAEGTPTYPGKRYLPLDKPPTAPWSGAEGWHFDLAVLHDCLRQPAEWKQRHGFPLEVKSVAAALRPEEASAEAWQRVVVDRPEHLLALMVLTADESGEALRGFAVQPGWQLQTDEPVLRLGPGWRDVLPELEEPPTEEWRGAWRAWGQSRNLPLGELEACHLERSGTLLRVQGPQPLLERLRTSRNDVVKGETWLFAGGEYTRSAALVEMAER